ncbi:hypothetical protein IAU59_006254 [Kwoniella sp. CBS 9459]
MRVGLPIHSPFKVDSEVATARYLREHLKIPTPRIVAYDPTNSNELHFPWMIMDFVPGESVGSKTWRTISMAKKQRLVVQLAHFHSILFNSHFTTIGSLTTRPREAPTNPRSANNETASEQTWSALHMLLVAFTVVLMIACLPNLSLLAACFWLWRRLEQNHSPSPVATLGRCSSFDFYASDASTSRGPFDTTVDWIYTRLYDLQARWISQVQPNAPLEELEYQLDMLRFTKRLIGCVPALFADERALGSTALLARDLHWGNVMVDEDDDLVAYIDWEFVSTVPLWAAARLPTIFHDRDYDEPKKERYPPMVIRGRLETPVDGVNRMYWTRMRDYEDTVLRNLFLAEMARINPGWLSHYHEGMQKREFLAMITAGEGMGLWDPYHIDWLDHFERGDSTDAIMDGRFDDLEME